MPDWLVLFLQHFVNGLALAGVYLLIALGITIGFGLTRIVNFAHGEIVTLGAFVALELTHLGVPVWIAIIVAACIVGFAAELVLDLGLFRRTLQAPLNGFLISLGLVIALQAAFSNYWRGAVYSLDPVVDGAWSIGNLTLNRERLFIIVVAGLLCVFFLLMLEHTNLGRGMRALAEDRIGAQVLGVPVGLLISIAFVVGAVLAALAGGLLGTVFTFSPVFGTDLLLKAFAVAIIGGLGNVRGAIIASLAVAFAETFGGAYISLEWAPAFSLITMIVVLLIRPYGLFGSERKGDVDPLRGSDFVADDLDERTASARGQRLLVWMPRFGVLALIALGLLFPEVAGSSRTVTLATFALVNAIAVYSLWFCFRGAGILSIAQAAFVGVGAYTTAWVALHVSGNFYLGLVLAVVAGSATAALFGFIALRTTGSNFLIVLFALSALLVVIATNGGDTTGGVLGLVLATPPTPLGDVLGFTTPEALYYLALVFLVLTAAFLWVITRSRFGRLLGSVRDNEMLARSLGLRTFRYRLAALTLSGGIAGLSGTLYMYVQVGIEPTFFTASTSIRFVLMLILGGTGVFTGPIVGAVIAVFLPEVLHLSPYESQFAYGILLVAIIAFLPLGVVGTARHWLSRVVIRGSNPRRDREPLVHDCDAQEVGVS